MKTSFLALAVAVVAFTSAFAQTATPPASGTAGQARPARGPEQTSVPNDAAPATTEQTTGARNQSPAVQQMNEVERSKVEAQGK